MSKIKVHVLNFHSIFSSHIELTLENMSVTPHTYYVINRWKEPGNEWSIEEKDLIAYANSHYTFDIAANPDEITKEWNKYWRSTDDDAGILGENCAVAAQKFLTHFANIPKPSLSNISWNLLAFGIMWPSFIPCPVTLPGRIMDNVKFHTQNRIFSCTSLQELPDDHENEYMRESIANLKKTTSIDANHSLAKLKTLTGFYDQLAETSEQADLLTRQGKTDKAEKAKQLLKNLKDHAQTYLVSSEGSAFSTFKSACEQEINKAKPQLQDYKGWKIALANIALAVVGVGVIYLLAASLNKATNGKFLFFSEAPLISDIKKSLSLTEEKYNAIAAKSLSTDERTPETAKTAAKSPGHPASGVSTLTKKESDISAKVTEASPPPSHELTTRTQQVTRS